MIGKKSKKKNHNQKRHSPNRREKVAVKSLPAIERQTSTPNENPAVVVLSDTSPDTAEEVIKPLPAQYIPQAPMHGSLAMVSRVNSLTRVNSLRGRRNSILPGTAVDPTQMVMKKIDSRKKMPSDSDDGPKIDDVVFTVNQEGEMEMFEVIEKFDEIFSLKF